MELAIHRSIVAALLKHVGDEAAAEAHDGNTNGKHQGNLVAGDNTGNKGRQTQQRAQDNRIGVANLFGDKSHRKDAQHHTCHERRRVHTHQALIAHVVAEVVDQRAAQQTGEQHVGHVAQQHHRAVLVLESSFNLGKQTNRFLALTLGEFCTAGIRIHTFGGIFYQQRADSVEYADDQGDNEETGTHIVKCADEGHCQRRDQHISQHTGNSQPRRTRSLRSGVIATVSALTGILMAVCAMPCRMYVTPAQMILAGVAQLGQK